MRIVGDDRWPIMLYWVVVLYWVMLTCIELRRLVVSYLALHFPIVYILICERALQSVLLVPLSMFRLRVLSRQNVIFCNCIMNKEHSVSTHGSLLITTSSHETLKIISFWSFFETKKYLFWRLFKTSKNLDFRVYMDIWFCRNPPPSSHS